MSELPKSRRKRLIRVVLGCGLLITTVLLVRGVLSRPPAADLSNGKRAFFLQTGLGSIRYSSDNAAEAYLRKQFPNAAQQYLSQHDTLSDQGRFSSNGALQLLLLFRYIANDEGNFLSRIELDESTGYTFSNLISGPSGRASSLASFVVPRFPRRDPRLNCRIYERGTDRLLLTLNVANPAYRPNYPVWTPDALPITKTAEPVNVTVRGFREEINPVDNMPVLDVVLNSSWDKLTHTVVYDDATGNTEGALSPFEAAWKAKVTVRRTSESSFTDSERWVLDPIPLPLAESSKRSGLRMINLKRTIDGIAFEVHFLMPPREPRPQFAQFWVTYDEPPGDVELLTIVRDQEGRLLNDPPASLAEGSPTSRYVKLRVQPESRSVQLTLIVNRLRTVEFLVAPPDNLRQLVLSRQSATTR